MTVVQVGRTFVGMQVSHDAAVGYHVHVLMLMRRVAIVQMTVVMEMVVLAVVAMRVFVIMRVAVRRAIRVVVLVRVFWHMADVVVRVFAVMAMAMDVAMHCSVQVHVLVLMCRFLPRAFDLGFAAAAATGRAHDVSPRCRLSRRRAAPKPTGGPLGGQRTQ
jgi:hypothetical protein